MSKGPWKCDRCEDTRIIWSRKQNKLVRCPDCTLDWPDPRVCPHSAPRPPAAAHQPVLRGDTPLMTKGVLL